MERNREYKSDMFSMLLEDKKNALEIYNLLNHSSIEDPEKVEMIRLEKGISLTVRNDAAFVVDMCANFYEHQSTYNPNMPLRDLIYFTSTLTDWVKEKDLDIFSRKRIEIPTPHFVVFYNGYEKRPEIEVMKLSQAFVHKTDEPKLELICTVYNLNPDCNEELKSKSPVLYGYCYFVDEVRRKSAEKSNLEEVLNEVIADCIAKGILVDFLTQRGDEIRKMTHLDFTFERREKLIYRDAKEEGLIEGRQEGRSEFVRQLILKQYTKDKILELGVTEEEYEAAEQTLSLHI